MSKYSTIKPVPYSIAIQDAETRSMGHLKQPAKMALTP